MSLVFDIRSTHKAEGTGLDITDHGEEAYTDGEGAILLLDDEVANIPSLAGAR
jgi:Amt family ammonium transporter